MIEPKSVRSGATACRSMTTVVSEPNMDMTVINPNSIMATTLRTNATFEYHAALSRRETRRRIAAMVVSHPAPTVMLANNSAESKDTFVCSPIMKLDALCSTRSLAPSNEAQGKISNARGLLSSDRLSSSSAFDVTFSIPQLGHTSALSETLFPHSGHFTNAMAPFPPHISLAKYLGREVDHRNHVRIKRLSHPYP